jgi:hypothetical protein
MNDNNIHNNKQNLIKNEEIYKLHNFSQQPPISKLSKQNREDNIHNKDET